MVSHWACHRFTFNPFPNQQRQLSKILSLVLKSKNKINLPNQQSCESIDPAVSPARGGARGGSVVCRSQSVGGEGGGGGLQGAGGVGASHVGQEVGVRAQLMDVEAVLLAVRQTPADKRLGSRARCVRQCV